MRRALLRIGAPAALIVSVCPAMLAADTPPVPAAPDLSRSLVVVIAEGQSNGVKRYAHATGFFIDPLGLLATSNHIRSDLGPIDPGTFKVNIYTDETSVTPLPAAEVYSSENTDVMILRASVGNLNFVPLRRGDVHRVKVNDTMLYTAGYPEGLPRQVYRGYVTSLAGPVSTPALVWVTSFNFAEGQSGSPVVDASGRVLGLVRGSDRAAPTIGFVVPAMVIPADYWAADQDDAGKVPITDTTSTLVASGSVAAVEPRARRIEINLLNVTCAPPTTLGKIIRPTVGWQIVPGSAKLATLRAVGTQSIDASTSTDQSQISVQARLANIGTCVRVFNNVISPDTPGEWYGEIDFTEAPLPGTRQNVTLARTAVVAGQPISFVASNVSNLRLTVEQPDGTSRDVAPSRQIVSNAKGGVVRINTAGLIASSRVMR